MLLYIKYLPRRLHPPADEQVGDDPGEQETQSLAGVNTSVHLDRRRNVQRLPEEEVLRGRGLLALLQGRRPVVVDGTLGPGQDRLVGGGQSSVVVLMRVCRAAANRICQ